MHSDGKDSFLVLQIIGTLNFSLAYRRSAFLFQIPILAFSVVLVLLKVSIPLSEEIRSQSTSEKLRRMDFFGSATLACTVGSLLLAFSLKESERLPWSHPLIWGLFIASGFCSIMFVLVEARWAHMPVLPLRLITQRTPLAVCLSNLFGSIAAFSVVCASRQWRARLCD
jgi:hypothetical protein